MDKEIEMFQKDVEALMLRRIFEEIFGFNHKGGHPFSSAFSFPQTANYASWVEKKIHSKGFTGKIGRSGASLYDQIIAHESIPSTGKADESSVNGFYLIGDSLGQIIYIGKSCANFREKSKDIVVYRIIDHLIPPSFNKLQNTPEIWESIRSGNKVQVLYYSGMNRLIPSVIELYILNKYYQRYGSVPQLNKPRRKR